MTTKRNEMSPFSTLVLCLPCLVLLSSTPASAQTTTAAPQVASNPQVNGAAHFDISPPIRDLARTVAPQFSAHQVHKVRSKQQPGGAILTSGVDGAPQTSPGPLVSATVGINVLGVGNGFNGYVIPDAPTDVNVAAGDTEVVQWVNVSYAVFDKASGAVI